MALPNGEFNGPIWVRGGIPIESAKDEIYEIRNRVTLCGCGRSSNKPFCDGTHRD
jgi:CDGSH-type Zn-finger protein